MSSNTETIPETTDTVPPVRGQIYTPIWDDTLCAWTVGSTASTRGYTIYDFKRDYERDHQHRDLERKTLMRYI